MRLTPQVSTQDLRTYLARGEAQDRIRQVLAARLLGAAKHVLDDLAQQTNLAALQASRRPSSVERVPGWVAGIAAFTALRYRRRVGRERARVVPEADAPVLDGRAAEPDDHEHGDVLTGWLEAKVAGRPRDRETLRLLREKAATGEDFVTLAMRHGTTEDTLKSQVKAFKRRYLPRWNAERAALLALLVAALATAVLSIFVEHRPSAPRIAAPSPSHP